jgi:hypothetical protein
MMARSWLYEHVEDFVRPGRVTCVYQYGHDQCCAEVLFSDGEQCWYDEPSNLRGDALSHLLTAISALVAFPDAPAAARWWEEPGEIRWVVRRAQDQLTITILAFADYDPHASDAAGELRLQTTVSFWAFVRRLLMAADQVSRVPVGQQQRHVTFANDLAYQALRRALQQRKSATS